MLYSVYSGYVGGSEKLRVLDPATGRDAVVGTVKAFGALPNGSRGLVYAVNARPNSRLALGKIVFVSTTRLDGLLAR